MIKLGRPYSIFLATDGALVVRGPGEAHPGSNYFLPVMSTHTRARAEAMITRVARPDRHDPTIRRVPFPDPKHAVDVAKLLGSLYELMVSGAMGDALEMPIATYYQRIGNLRATGI
jgi:hypothetical protein